MEVVSDRAEPEPEFDTPVIRLSQTEFVDEVFVPNYEPGQHVAFMGPTRSGKTTIAYKLLDRLATPKLPAIILVMKPRDDVVVDWSKLAGFRKTEVWPPIIQRAWRKKGGGFGKKQRGWVFWPRHSLSDIQQDNRKLAVQFRRVLTECYKKGDRIVFADEVVGLSKDLGLEEELTAIWSRGGSMECGLWAASQRPYHAPVIMYSASAHLLIFRDDDKRSTDRYDEIGGIDGDVVKDTVRKLRRHEFLYIGRFAAEDEVSPALAIVGAD